MNAPKYIPGDLVMNRKHTVLKIEDMVAGMLYTKCQDGISELYISRKDVLPISLTPAILEANGWIKNPFGEGGFIERYTQNGLTLFIYHTEDDEWICKIGDYDVKIKFVHQFQHLLFGLGLESELKI